MRKLLVIIAAAAMAAPALHAAAPAPRAKASDSAKAAFIKKCFRDQTKKACTAPPAARVKQ
ncbi:MAG TPA: hypothetical protein VFM98_20465 [Ramlibacter sp.]|uniref:hypothetical protein n=1 Tax=Ramlibacter sp. TaxID=1917967 RepID=UPI002D8007E4|nr:hypothetical protein [Ramlibacter sp.]HET8747983.1 hypothetical protein [Ramlibacter sp.]